MLQAQIVEHINVGLEHAILGTLLILVLVTVLWQRNGNEHFGDFVVLC